MRIVRLLLVRVILRGSRVDRDLAVPILRTPREAHEASIIAGLPHRPVVHREEGTAKPPRPPSPDRRGCPDGSAWRLWRLGPDPKRISSVVTCRGGAHEP